MIEARRLTKVFGQRSAVDDISFIVGPGEVLGFLGPNAAGKSTTMRMLTGFLLPTSGTALIEGEDIIESSLSARAKIGYLPENAPVYPEMTVIGFLDFIAQIRGFSGRQKTRRVQETLDRCFLSDVKYQTVSTLSKGYKQRVCFAQSILHDPPYLIMDEPTDGLDPNQKHEVRGMIRQMGEKKTIILSTHNLEEVEAVCTRAIIIAQGKIVADDTPAGLKERSSLHGAVCFSIRGLEEDEAIRHTAGIPEVKSVEVLKRADSALTLRAYPKDPASPPTQEIVQHLGRKGHPPERLFVEEGRLDEVFRMITSTGEPGRGTK